MPFRVPATRTLNGPIAYSEFSCVGPAPRMAAAAGEASTRTVALKRCPPAAAPILPAGNAGNGVPATTAA